MVIYFKNLIVRLHILYVFNMNVKCHSNWMLITIRFINVLLLHNLRLQKIEI